MGNARGDSPSLYDDAQAAAYLNSSKRHLERLRSRRELTFHRVGRKIRYKRSDLDAYLESNRVGALS